MLIFSVQHIDYSSIINDECGHEYETEISTVDLSLFTTNRNTKETEYGHPYMNLKIGMLINTLSFCATT